MGSFAGLKAALTIPNDIKGYRLLINKFEAFILDTPYYSITSLVSHGILNHFSYAAFLSN